MSTDKHLEEYAKTHDHTGKGYIWTPILKEGSRDIPFLVDGQYKWGHIGYLSPIKGDEPRITEKGDLLFFVKYITDFGTQGAHIPNGKIHWNLFNQITGAQPAFFVFRNENEFINGIGNINYRNHEEKDYNDKWLFWEV